MKKKKSSHKRLVRFNWLMLRVWLLVIPAFGLLFVTLTGFYGDQWWLLDIFANFRLQYTWIAVVLLFYCGLLKIWHTLQGKLAIVALVLALAVNSWLVGSLYVPLNSSQGESNVTVLFSNIFIYNNRSTELLRYIRNTDPDVIALAEVNDRMFGFYQRELAEKYPFAYHKRHKRLFGVAIFSKTKPANEDFIQLYSENALPSLKFDLTFNEKPVSVIVTHPYPPMNEWFYQQRNAQLLGLAESVGQSDTATIVVGDFNMTPWSPLFKQLLEKGELHSSMQGMGVQTSWPTWMPSPMRIPIDHALYKGNLEVVGRERGPMTGSDHKPILTEFKLTE